MKKLKQNSAITLIALVITIVILLILAGIAVRAIFGEDGVIDRARQAEFVHNYRTVEEAVKMYYDEKLIFEQIGATGEGINAFSLGTSVTKNVERLPVKAEMTDSEKEEAINKIPTLEKTVQSLTGESLSEMNAYWINLDILNLDMRNRYIIDAETLKIYDFEGEKFLGKRWHVIEEGYKEDGTTTPALKDSSEGEIWDGWITMTLYYPVNSTERQWRLGEEGELRYDSTLMWQDYTGPITVRLTDVENVWIRYKIDGEEVIVAPEGRVVVDIQPDSCLPTIVDEVHVKIAYDESAELKEYKIGNGGWQPYTGEFTVTENTIIEARAKKTETISDSAGNIIGTKAVWGRDNFYVGNINVEAPDEALPAPTITRLAATESNEVAKVKVEYPSEAAKKVYKLNYGKEIEYTEEISIEKYGTHVIAYYYDANGKKSLARQITIDEDATTSSPYTPNPSGTPSGSSGSNPTSPTYVIPEPNINVSTTNVVENTTGITVSISTPNGQVADKMYYNIDNGAYQEYTGSFTVNTNCVIRAYYINIFGERSSTGYRRINNLREPNKPYVALTATPDEYTQKYGATSVKVEITSIDADKLEYSLDGIVYKTYTGPLTITKNQRVYAKGTNANGTTVEYIDITNINGGPTKISKLSVEIQVDPDPDVSDTLHDSAKVTIAYDEKATGKYYTIGYGGELKEYTGPFDITSNCTIYAYATGENAKGSTSKLVDNLTTGISEPQITVTPSSKQAGEVKVNIKFDKNAKITRYKIDGDSYRDYTGELTISENCTITAYNSNSLGHEATSSKKIENVVKQTTILIDKGDYYLLKLNYPEGATGREYKWQDDGIWKSYSDQGILLIKPEYKDNILDAEGNVKIKIEDDTGKKIDFTGDYYFVTSTIQDLMEHVYLRWNTTVPSTPNIILSTTEPTKELSVTITYPTAGIVLNQYRVQKPDGTTTGWQDYTGTIYVEDNQTIIYARCKDEAEMWSETATKLITNIDETAPTITVTADLENAKQKVGIKVQALDDVQVRYVKWAQGIRGTSYFASNGTAIENNSVFYVTENGYYTIYAEDGVGNGATYTLQVGNVDLDAPNIDISMTTDTGKVATTVNIAIDYGDSTTKQYKIGENNNTWTNYTGEFSLTSNTVLANGWANEDLTVTIYAKGTDTAGNEQTVQEYILLLDVDAPQVPVINSNYGYPVLTEYGVQLDGETTITYDTRTDITNYYSFDGTTWEVYTGKFDYPQSGVIYAKSVKNSSGLTVDTSKTITQPNNAMKPEGYEAGKTQTLTSGEAKIAIAPELWGKEVEISYISDAYNNAEANRNYLVVYNEEGVDSKTYKNTWGATTKETITIKENTTAISLISGTATAYEVVIYEVRLVDDPTYTVEKVYPTLTLTGVEKEYINIKPEYYATSIERMYKINDEEWKNYSGGKIKINPGDVIHFKGKNSKNIETKIISYTYSMPDAMKPEGYEAGKTQTLTSGEAKIAIAPELWGKEVEISYISQARDNEEKNKNYLVVYNEEGIDSKTYKNTWGATTKETITIKENTTAISLISGTATAYYVVIYEVKLVDY